ncbi:MAG TPA: C1 family peptidase [Terriglobales bacterium]|nr:C1 family peptidase [Terriglobales bacterium]
MFRELAKTSLRDTRWLLGPVALSLVLVFASQARGIEPCCLITAIDTRTGLLTAREKSSGQVFQFRVTSAPVLSTLRVGQGVYANFKTRQVSLDGRSVAGTIVSGPGPAPGAAPAAQPVPAPPLSRTPPAPAAAVSIPRTPAAPVPAAMVARKLTRRTGLKLPPDEYILQQAAHQNQLAGEILKLERQAIDTFEKLEAAAGRPSLPETTLRAKLPPPTAQAFDWTKLRKVTPVRNQDGCGSCWDFGAVAALESSILIRYNLTADPDLSEQYVLDNAVYGSCSDVTGGWTPEAFTEMMLLGTAKESDLPYIAKKQGPRLIQDNPYRALIWGFVGNGVFPSVKELKEALLRHGPLPVSIEATQSFEDYFNNYPGAYPNQVFNERARGRPNHVVLIVGWDDAKGAWRIKNSWGATNEGDNGFGWVAYGSNSIGMGATWVEAWNSRIPLPPVILEWLEKAKKLAREAEQEARAAVEQAERAVAQAQAAADRAKSEAERVTKEAEQKAHFAAEQSRIAAEKEKEVAAATTQAEKNAKQAAAKAAREAANKANAEAAKAKTEADRASKAAQDTLNSAAKAIAAHIPAPPDPRKHLPHFP